MSVSDEVKQRIDIVEYISRYTPLKKAGRTYKGLCPFHSERTPSFVVYPETGTWRCYGACGTGGDVFAFLMRKENLEFREALQVLAREAGVQLEQPSGESSHRDALYAINEAAATYFYDILRSHAGAAQAREYVARRGINGETVEKFRIGYALDGWNGLRDFLSEKGFSVDDQLLAGLVKRHEERGTIYDAYRNRLMTPIRDRTGHVIGFGGRVLDNSQPKYLNTAETPVFHKSHVVYGIDLAYQAIRDMNRVVIVEGYMDVIAAHQHGFSNVVACMGTALTPEQLRQLQRYTSNFVLALDADSAGQQATMRGLNQARQSLVRVQRPVAGPRGVMNMEERLGANLLVCSMPEGQDPDDVIRHDPDLWKELVGAAQPLVEFYLGVAAKQLDLSTASGKAALVTELAPLIAELDDEIERQHYIQAVSRLVQVDELIVAGRVQASARTSSVPVRPRQTPRTMRGRGQRPRAPLAGENGSGPPPVYDEYGPPMEDDYLAPQYDAAPIEAPRKPSKPGNRGASKEDYLLACLLHEPDLLIQLSAEAEQRTIDPLSTEDWEHVENQEIFRALMQYMAGDAEWDVELFQEGLIGELHGRLGMLLAEAAHLPAMPVEELRTALLKVLVRMREDRLKSEGTHIKHLVDEAQRSGDMEAVRGFSATNNRNLRMLSQLQDAWVGLTRVLAVQGRAEKGVKIR